MYLPASCWYTTQERAAALMATLKRAPTPRYLVADSKLYHEDNAANLGFQA